MSTVSKLRLLIINSSSHPDIDVDYVYENKTPSPITNNNKIYKPITMIKCLNCDKHFPDNKIIAESYCSMDCLSSRLYVTGDLYLEKALYGGK